MIFPAFSGERVDPSRELGLVPEHHQVWTPKIKQAKRNSHFLGHTHDYLNAAMSFSPATEAVVRTVKHGVSIYFS